jgi:rifampin ADP-ribosylating transferase
LVVSGDYLYFTPDLDAAIWAAELAEGELAPRVYQVEPTGAIEDAAARVDHVPPPHPSMSWRTVAPLVVVDEVTQWTHYHGTKASLAPGDIIEPGHAANFGPAPRTANFVYFTRTLDASIWGAELAAGEGPGRIYLVEPTGPIEDDPNLTNARFRGNPTKSFRSRAPLRVVGEYTDWRGHPPERVRTMKEGLARLDLRGVVPDD